jgi:hypothetical protein
MKFALNLVLTFLAIASAITRAQSLTAGQQIKFVVVSVRMMSEKEASERNGDCIGCSDVAIRVRLTAGLEGLHFYAWPGSKIPSAFEVWLNGDKTFWAHGPRCAEWKPTSPGKQAMLSGFPGKWTFLRPGASAEWEEFDSTDYAGQVHAFSIFIRDGTDAEREVFSSSFVVPLSAKPPKLPVQGSFQTHE